MSSVILSDEYFICPLTLDRFVDPVFASDGHTYSRAAILRHYDRNGYTSPVTREPVYEELRPNYQLVSLLASLQGGCKLE
jgi:hypothetical protein